MSRRVFFCYARENQDFALQLAEHLKKRGVPIWLDQWDIPPEADWDKTIDTALHDCAHLLIVLSRVSVESREVRGELRTALDLGKPVLPVLHEHCEIPRQLRVVQFVDFTNRQPDDEDALNQLVRVCTGEAAAPGASRTERRNPKWTWPRLAGLRGLGMRSKVLLSSVLAMVVVGLLWFGVDALTEERRRLNDAALSPDGSYLATANGQGLGVRGTVRIWEVSSGRELSLISNKGPVWVSTWSPDGKRLATGDHSGSIRIYEAGTWRQLSELTGPRDFTQFIAWSPDGSAVATGDSAGSLWVWGVMNGALRFTRPHHAQAIHAVAWAPDGRRLATASWDRSIAIVDAHDGNLLTRLQGHSSHVNTVAFSPSGEWVASGSLEAPYLIVWDAKGRPQNLDGHRGSVERVAWSADGRYLASASKDNTVQFWDGQRFSLIRRVSLGGQFNSGTSLAWSADGTRLAAGDSASVRILSAQSDTGQQKLTERADDAYDSVEIAGWSADGTRLGSFSRDERTARVWDTATANVLATFRIGVFRSIAE